MSVAITWSISGTAVTSVDHSSGNNGDTLTAKEITIEHDSSNSITNCQFYIGQQSEASYDGDATAMRDLDELLAWGDGADADAFGGFQVNMDAVGSFPGSKWPTYSSKYGTDYSAFYTGRGDSSENGIVLSQKMASGMTGDGTIPSGVEAKFRCRIQIPTDEDTPGVRQFVHNLRYTWTS